MNVIVHQAIAQNPGAVMGGVPGQKTQIETSVCSRIKYGLAIVSPLCDVVGNAGNHYARATGHTAKVPGRMQSSQELNASDPFLCRSRQWGYEPELQVAGSGRPPDRDVRRADLSGAQYPGKVAPPRARSSATG